MQVNVEKLSPVLVEFQIRIPADDVRQSMDRAFNDLARGAQIKGFRKGKAPRHVLAHLFGDRVATEVANKLVEETLAKALQDQKIRPVSNPVIEKPKPSAAEDFAFRARFEVTPDIDAVVYEGLEVKRPVYAVDDKQIDAEIENMRVGHATIKAPEAPRPAKHGDVVTIDFTLDLAGKPFEPAASSNVTAEIGTSSLLPQIGEALTGKEAGAKLDVEVTFPGNHPQEAFRNQKAVFHVALKDIKEKVLPELDDAFAKDCECDNLEALRASVRARLEKDAKDHSENDLAVALVSELCKKNPIPVPPSLVQQQAQLQENEVLQQARRQGHTANSVSPELRRTIAADAELKVRAGLVMAEIAKKQGIQVTEADINKAYEELAEQTGKNVNKIKVQYQDARQREILIGMIVEDKILNIIEAAAKIEDVPATQGA